MRPELPFLAAGAVAVIGATIREKHWPTNANGAIIGTVVLTLAASASAGSRIAPLVHAIGLLLLTSAVLASVKSATSAKKG